MSEYILNVTNPSGETGSIVPDIGFEYTDLLNNVNEATIKVTSLGTVKRGLLVMGSSVEIKRDGTVEFIGLLDGIDKFKGGVSFHASGWEIWLSKENGSYASSPYQATASATIFGDLIGESTIFTAGTVEAGSNIDFRIALSDSLYNAISNLARKTQQDVGIDYPNLEVDVLDHKGSSSSVATFNEGIQISDVRWSQGYPQGTIVKVFGKGDGANQIIGSAQDAGAISTYGSITFPVTDRTVISTDEANTLAAAELAIRKQPTDIYDFDVINFNQSFVSGDHLTLNAGSIDLSNEEVRIMGVVRGERGNSEFLTLQVANPEVRQALNTRNKILAGLQKQSRDTDTYMQGSGNTLTWARGINAKLGAPLTLPFNVPSTFITDEAGNIRVDSMTVDYDIDPYKKGVGTASFDGSDPQVQNSSANTQPTVSGNSSNTPNFTAEGADSSTDTLSVGFNNNLLSVAVSGTYEYLLIEFIFTPNFTPGGQVLFAAEFDGVGTSRRRPYIFTAGMGHIADCIWVPMHQSVSGNITLDLYCDTVGSWDTSMTVYGFELNHLHADGTYAAANHPHADGSYDIDNADIDNISIGDDVSDAGGVNASEVDIFLDFWNGSAWVNKHSIIDTGATLETDVDITDGGTYPDAAGYWRVRVEPDNAAADFAQAIVKIKHSLDS